MVIRREFLQRHTQLSQVVDALNSLCPPPDLRDGCQQKGHQYPNDGYYHQQFHQRKALSPITFHIHSDLSRAHPSRISPEFFAK